MKSSTYCTEYARYTRRDFLSTSLSSMAGLMLGRQALDLPDWLPRIQLADPHVGPRGDTLICLFLRGGADGLNMIVPHGDPAYYALRPTLAIPQPDARSSGAPALDLDGFFGLHPALQPLESLFRNGQLAAVHATGSPDETRSHFAAMDYMERGAIDDGYSGWLARHLSSLNTQNESALRAVGIGTMLPRSLAGTEGFPLTSLEGVQLRTPAQDAADFRQLLTHFYDRENGLLQQAAAQTLDTIDLLANVSGASPRTRPYPDHPFGAGLQVVADLISAEVGVEVACVDFGGWDTHATQGGSEGQMANNLSLLAEGLAALAENLRDNLDKITVVVMSEFGRRAAENGSQGTDHGHGNMLLALGGGINGGQVYGQWPGLETEQLVGPGDLAITTDYRHVLAEILEKRLNNPQTAVVFPGFEQRPLGVCRPLSQ